jgi:formylglycine-generating enzyme required for sulfatase activity
VRIMVNKRIGLVIGNNYPNSNRELKFAVSDAKKMKEILENKDICGFDEVVYLVDRTSKDASKEVDRILRKADNDLVFIYYSGHGTKDHERKLCLLFKDTEDDAILATSLSFDFIQKCINYPNQKSVIIALDCCYSGAAGIGEKAGEIDVTDALRTLSGSGTVILTATGSIGSPTAREDEKLGHGIFTHYLIEGLEKGYADQNGDGLISIDELYDYIYKKTTENCKQSPKREGRIEGIFQIGINPQKIRENKYELIKKKLFDELSEQLPSDVLGECQTILRKCYKTNCPLDKGDRIILDYLESLLKDDILKERRENIIQNCIEAVQQLQMLHISTNSIFQNTDNRRLFNSYAPITDNTMVNDLSNINKDPKSSKNILYTEPVPKIETEVRNKDSKRTRLAGQEDDPLVQTSECLQFIQRGKEKDENSNVRSLIRITSKEFESNCDILIQKLEKGMCPTLYCESLTILKKYYENPSSLSDIDNNMLFFLKSLLDDKFSVEVYATSVQRLKKKNDKCHKNGQETYKFVDKIHETFKSPFTDMEFVLIPAGEFIMGSPSEEQGRYDNENPLHRVKIKKPFYMGKYPVTQKKWEKVMESNPSHFKGDNDNRPVECVSWYDVQEFIKKLNIMEEAAPYCLPPKYRLPSEAEWEYACRAGTKTRYSFSDDELNLSEYAWYKNNSDGQTQPVGQMEPNSWGLHDMHGSVWEWVQDSSHDSYKGAHSDGSAWEEGYGSLRMLRGGSWNTHARLCRSAVRFGYFPDNRNFHLGFRLLRDL